MALINCPECNRQVSDSAVSCPNCGFGVKEYTKRQQDILKIQEESKKEAIAFVEKAMAEREQAKQNAEKEKIFKLNQQYEKAIVLFQTDSVVDVNESEKIFKSLDGWKDSEEYLKKIEERKADASKREQQRFVELEQEKQRKIEKKKKRIKTIAVISSIFTAIIIAVFLLTFCVWIPSQKYDAANNCYNKGDYFNACSAFLKLGNYKDSKEMFAKSEAALMQKNISCDSSSCIAIKNDGSILISNEQWKADDEKNLQNVNNIISVGCGNSAFALNKYGQLLQISSSEVKCIENNIIAMYGQHNMVTAITRDGKIYIYGDENNKYNDTKDWNNVVAVSVAQYHILGIKNDGTVISLGNNKNGECNVENWNDIVMVSAALNHSVGLKSDGTVVAVGDNSKGQCDVSSWKDIVSVSANNYFTIGLKSDGTIVSTGLNEYMQRKTKEWKDISEITTSYDRVVGIKNNGNVICTVTGIDDSMVGIGYWKNVNNKKSPIPDEFISEYSMETIATTEETTIPSTTAKKEKTTEKPTEVVTSFEPDGEPISIENKLSELKDWEGLCYYFGEYRFDISKKKAISISKISYISENAGSSTLVLGETGIISKNNDSASYYIDVNQGGNTFHVVMIFYDNGVDITGLDGIDNGSSCNGFYAYDSIISRGG